MIDVEIEDDAWTAALPGAADVVERACEAVFARLSTPSPQGEDLTVLLSDDDAVRALNGRFRGKDAATNVLSFPAPATARPHLGDIALAFGVCAREAQAQQKPLAHHLTHLTVHGVLHLLGYDHLSDRDAEVMEDLERDILSGLDLPDPYASNPDTAGRDHDGL